MTLSEKKVREITGFTFSEIGSDPENWMTRASSLLKNPSQSGANMILCFQEERRVNHARSI